MVSLVFLLLAVFDAWFTAKRIPQLGIEAEHNPLIRWLSYKYGVKTGIYAGVLVPTILIMLVGITFPELILYLLGCRTTLFAFQVKVLNANIGTKQNSF
jgi:hypothetical protein